MVQETNDPITGGSEGVGPPFQSQDTPRSTRPTISAHSSQDTPTLAGSTPRNTSLERVAGSANEQSPLLSSSDSGGGEDDGLVDDTTVLDDQDEYQATKSIWYLIMLTISLGGLQMAWSVELSNGSPYLLSLGLDKSLMALVWIAGPLSGTLVQPYVGIRSDNCRISWGKRKPFMLGGAIATIISLLALAWTRELVGGFLELFGADRQSQAVKNVTIVVAVFFVYVLDFAINTVQAAIRAFMVDCAPTHQQESVNAMGSRVTGIFNIIGYTFGYINLPKYMWFFGNTQFKVLCVIASLALATTIIISLLLIKERDPRLEGPPTNDRGGVRSFFKGVFTSIKRLPPQTRKVCEVQFFAWIGWFGFLFYLSTWVGELYVQPFLIENPNRSPDDLERLYEKATRVGTLALLIWAITSLISSLLLPLLVTPTYDMPTSSAMSVTSQKSYTTRMERILDWLVIPWLSLRRAWMLSLVLFGVCMFSTLFIRTPAMATIVVAIVGISWAMTIWAPFAIISAEISKRDAIRRSQQQSRCIIDPGDDNGDQAGVILGIHNVAIAAPQVIATVGSSAIFKVLQKRRGTPGDRSMPAVLAVGGIFALMAAFMATRLAEEKETPVEQPESRARHRRSLSRSASFGATLNY